MPTFILNSGKENEGSISIPGDFSFSIMDEVQKGTKTTTVVAPRRNEEECTFLLQNLPAGILDAIYPDALGKVNGKDERQYRSYNPSGSTFKIPADSGIRVIFQD